MKNTVIPFMIENDEFTSETHDELTHWHNSFELIEILDGNFYCHVDGNSFIANKGDICVINRGRMHRVLNEKGKNLKCRKKTLIFDPDFFIKNEEIYNKYVRPLLENDAFSHMQFHTDSGIGLEIFTLINDIEQLHCDQPDGFEMESYALIYMIMRRLYLASRTHRQGTKSIFDSNAQIQRRMTSFIYQNYPQKIGLDDIADAGQISRSTCIRLFHEYTGKSPIDFLNSFRLETSTQQLLNTAKRITEISFSCGFSQPSYYNRMFLKEYGMTPNEYRKKHMRISN